MLRILAMGSEWEAGRSLACKGYLVEGDQNRNGMPCRLRVLFAVKRVKKMFPSAPR